MSGQIRYINWEDNSNIKLSTCHLNGPHSDVAFLPGREADPLFISGGRDGVTKLWTSKTCDQLIEYASSSKPITLVMCHPELKLVAVCSQEGNVTVYNVQTLGCSGQFSVGDARYVNSGEWHKDNMLVGMSDGSICTVSCSDWSNIQTVQLQPLTSVYTNV